MYCYKQRGLHSSSPTALESVSVFNYINMHLHVTIRSNNYYVKGQTYYYRAHSAVILREGTEAEGMQVAGPQIAEARIPHVAESSEIALLNFHTNCYYNRAAIM